MRRSRDIISLPCGRHTLSPLAGRRPGLKPGSHTRQELPNLKPGIKASRYAVADIAIGVLGRDVFASLVSPRR